MHKSSKPFDSRLIDYEWLKHTEITTQCDTATPTKIKKGQSDRPMGWNWESYQISSEIYAVKKSIIDEAYYKKYILIIHQPIGLAGIRLSGELNKLFKGKFRVNYEKTIDGGYAASDKRCACTSYTFRK